MANMDFNAQPSHSDDQGLSVEDYLHKATQAVNGGSLELAMHLYLAAFERSKRPNNAAPNEAAIEGLKKAWALACNLKERALAEYVFEQMEPYLSNDELMACTSQLQDLALDKLEEYGLSREELEDMSEMLSQDFMGMGVPAMFQFDSKLSSMQQGGAAAKSVDSTEQGIKEGEAALAEPEAAKRPTNAAEPTQGSAQPGDSAQSAIAQAVEETLSKHGRVETIDRIDFSNLVGYDAAIRAVNDFGIGMAHDQKFQDLVASLNMRHGLNSMPACDTLFLRSPAREDANRFASAIIGELGLPAVRMHMEENMQGMPVLCVMAQADNQPKLNSGKNEFVGPGVLVLEDLDSWMPPETSFNAPEDFAGFIMASLSRGAREAITLIRSAVENPDVYVFATMALNGDIDGFFFDLLDPVSVVDIDYPSAAERGDIWLEIAREHPSFRGINRQQLIQLSANMPRYDIYMAAREAVDEAYKESLVERAYVPVTSDNIFDKLAAYQPLDSDEYQALEEAVITNFKQELDHLEDLLDEGK